MSLFVVIVVVFPWCRLDRNTCNSSSLAHTFSIAIPPNRPYEAAPSHASLVLCDSLVYSREGMHGYHLRSISLCPACEILLPPLSSSCSNTPIFSSDFMTFRSTAPLASTWCEGLEPRFLVLPWTLRNRPTPTVFRR